MGTKIGKTESYPEYVLIEKRSKVEAWNSASGTGGSTTKRHTSYAVLLDCVWRALEENPPFSKKKVCGTLGDVPRVNGF